MHTILSSGDNSEPSALTGLWGLGHLATLVLFDRTANHQLRADHPIAAPLARPLSDHNPAA
ncbi:hypothetical protein ABGB16_29940 [Micromonospora sp. B11E3]|uniref:hypothetical protein n=1 Tax=Micromonospora sp. B11E3 TaxID=3153562 RepID=UPI00325E5A1F